MIVHRTAIVEEIPSCFNVGCSALGKRLYKEAPSSRIKKVIKSPIDRCGDTRLNPKDTTRGITNFQPGKNVNSLKSKRTSCVSKVNVLYRVKVNIKDTTSMGLAPQYNRVGTTKKEMAIPVYREISAAIIPIKK